MEQRIVEVSKVQILRTKLVRMSMGNMRERERKEQRIGEESKVQILRTKLVRMSMGNMRERERDGTKNC